MEKIIINEMGMRYVRIPFLTEEKASLYVSEYEGNILKHANISGLSEVSVQEVDGNTYLLYPIYSYISLKEKLERGLLNVEQFLDFFGQLLKVYEKMQMYLLDGKEICLEPEYIFYNQEEKKYVFLPITVDTVSFSEKYEKLFTFFADKCPLEEKKLLGFIFENFATLTKEQFEPIAFLKYIVEYDFEDKSDSFCEIEEDTCDYVDEDDESNFEKSKMISALLISIGFLMLALWFAYLSDVETKYGIISIAASFISIGIVIINFLKICQTNKKSQAV